MASSSSSSSRRSLGWTYDVFLSFRGEDTRTSFVDHLYTALDDRSIYTFKDDQKLKRAQSICPEILKSIEQSRFAVVVFSRNYADSPWCLDELVKIVDCKNSMGQTFLPVFYDVHPSEVRKQKKGRYKEAFLKYESLANNNEKQKERVERWREALAEAASISGWYLPKTANGQEAKCIKKIVSTILSNPGQRTTLSMADDLIGIESRIKKVKSVLCMGSGDIRIIGIWGMGGMGKTTVARAVFDEFSHLFEGSSCFVANVREVSERNGLHSLQKEILSTILMEKDLEIADVYNGVAMMSRRLSRKRVLLVLDDVDNVEQLEALARKREWFGRGSRIVITTRDKHVLLVGNRVDEIHTLDFFNDDEALQLFSRYAFGQDSPPEEFVKSSKLVVRYAGGLPLPLKVLGSFLYGRDMIEWRSALDRLKDTPEKQILDILKISFEGLKDVEKKIFLDIACFFKGMKRDEVTPILDSFDFHPDIGISVLIQRCLVSVLDEGRLQMHDLIQEMGWHMAQHTRLWLGEHLNDLFSKNTGMEAIEAIKLVCGGGSKTKFSWGPFRHMEKLRLLDVFPSDDLELCEGPEYLSNELRWICFSRYPSKFLPESFLAEKLVCLEMPDSKIVQLWKGKKHLDKLKVINLRDSINLKQTIDFSTTPNLEKLVLRGCRNLEEVHPSIGDHKRLVVLDLCDCEELRSFPSALKMVSLETLNLSHCSKLRLFPQILVNMEKLASVCLRGSAIEELHPSIEKLTGLLFLDLRWCKSLRFIPNNICRLKSLKSLQLYGSPRLEELPENLGHIECLEELLIEETTIRQPPSTIVLLKNLKTLSFKGSKGVTSQSWSSFFSSWLLRRRQLQSMGLVVPCLKRLDLSYSNLLEVPSDLSPLLCLEELNLSGNDFSSLPSNLCQLSRLKILELHYCTKLESLRDLPPSISIIVADDCQSLKSLTYLSSTTYEWLWFVSFLGCFKLLVEENHQGIEGSSSRSNVADMLLESLLQGRSVINYQFSIFLPGREIPDCFSQPKTVMEDMILELPPNWHNKITGFAMCFAYNCNSLAKAGRIFMGRDGSIIGAHFRAMAKTPRPVADCDQIWIGYISLDLLHQTVLPGRHKDDWLGIEQGGGYLCISPRGILQGCGAQLVYKEDVKQQQMMIEDTSLSPETWPPKSHFYLDIFSHPMISNCDPFIPHDFKRLVMNADHGIS